LFTNGDIVDVLWEIVEALPHGMNSTAAAMQSLAEGRKGILEMDRLREGTCGGQVLKADQKRLFQTIKEKSPSTAWSEPPLRKGTGLKAGLKAWAYVATRRALGDSDVDNIESEEYEATWAQQISEVLDEARAHIGDRCDPGSQQRLAQIQEAIRAVTRAAEPGSAPASDVGSPGGSSNGDLSSDDEGGHDGQADTPGQVELSGGDSGSQRGDSDRMGTPPSSGSKRPRQHRISGEREQIMLGQQMVPEAEFDPEREPSDPDPDPELEVGLEPEWEPEREPEPEPEPDAFTDGDLQLELSPTEVDGISKLETTKPVSEEPGQLLIPKVADLNRALFTRVRADEHQGIDRKDVLTKSVSLDAPETKTKSTSLKNILGVAQETDLQVQSTSIVCMMMRNDDAQDGVAPQRTDSEVGAEQLGAVDTSMATADDIGTTHCTRRPEAPEPAREVAKGSNVTQMPLSTFISDSPYKIVLNLGGV
jgi:hypothetical protein